MLNPTERKQWQWKAGSRRYQLYRFWEKWRWGGKSLHPENLCHVFWIVLLRAPALWFFRAPLHVLRRTRVYWIRPWMIAAIALYIGAFVWWTSFMAVATAVVIGVSIILVWLFMLEEESPVAIAIGLVLTFVFWIIPFLLYIAGKWVWSEYKNQIVWFFTRRYFKVVNPAVVTALLALAIVYLLAEPAFWYILAGIGIVIAAVVVLTLALLVLLGLSWLFHPEEFNLLGRLTAPLRRRWRRRRMRRAVYKTKQVTRAETFSNHGPEEHPAATSTSSFRMFWTMAVALKHRVCPLILLPEDQKHTL